MITHSPARSPAPWLSIGCRPFFLAAALWAAGSMVLWIGLLAAPLSVVNLPTAFDPVSWHAHAFLFGYLGAVLAGFLLTAVPNWTGRAPLTGWPLGAMALLWFAGRVAVAGSAWISPAAVAAIDLAFPLCLMAIVGRDILAARNWRNLPPLTLVALFIIANALFHRAAAQGELAFQSIGLRLGLGTAVMLIALIGGRIIPVFTRNWLVKRGATRLPPPPQQRVDAGALLALAGALMLWTLLPNALITAAALVCAAGAHLMRLMRWRGQDTLSEPLVWVLHVAYGLVPLGALANACAILGLMPLAPALHLWMSGAIGGMTLAVMTRASLGHTGRALTAGPGTAALYICLLGATVTRLAAGVMPTQAMTWYAVSAALWIGAFGGFALLYGPALLRPRV